MGKRGLKKKIKSVSMFGLILVFGLMVTSAALAATKSSSVIDKPFPPVKRKALSPAAATSLLNQPPDQSTGWYADTSNPWTIADDFVLVSPMMVNQIVLWGGYATGNTPPAVDDFTVIIHQDNAGFPGTVVYSQSGIVPTERTPTGVILFGSNNEYQFTLDLPNAVTLPAGSYWVEFFDNTPSTPDSFFVESGTLDPLNGRPNHVYAPETPGINWINQAEELALQINYVPNASASIPTMNEWGMIIMALLIAGISMWMIKQRKAEI